MKRLLSWVCYQNKASKNTRTRGGFFIERLSRKDMNLTRRGMSSTPLLSNHQKRWSESCEWWSLTVYECHDNTSMSRPDEVPIVLTRVAGPMYFGKSNRRRTLKIQAMPIRKNMLMRILTYSSPRLMANWFLSSKVAAILFIKKSITDQQTINSESLLPTNISLGGFCLRLGHRELHLLLSWMNEAKKWG